MNEIENATEVGTRIARKAWEAKKDYTQYEARVMMNVRHLPKDERRAYELEFHKAFCAEMTRIVKSR